MSVAVKRAFLKAEVSRDFALGPVPGAPVYLGGRGEMRPEIAEGLLDLLGSPSYSTFFVEGLVSDLVQGVLPFSGNALILTEEMEVLSDPSILVACVHSKVPVDMFVIMGVPKEVDLTIDAYRTRSLKDSMAIAGLPKPPVLSRAVKVATGYATGSLMSKVRNLTNAEGIEAGRAMAPGRDLNTSAGTATMFEIASHGDQVFGSGVALALLYLFDRVDPVGAVEFFEALRPNAPPAGTPFSKAGRIVVEEIARSVLNAGPMEPMARMAYAVNAWNCARLGGPIVVTDPHGQGMPLIDGVLPSDVKADLMPAKVVRSRPGRRSGPSKLETLSFKVYSPDEVRAVIENKGKNRSPSKTVVGGYSRDLLADWWKANGETVKFNRAGKLKDGLQRFEGAAAANLPLATFVVEGISESAFRRYDQGRKRNFSMVLKGRDVAVRAMWLASATRWFWLIRTGRASLRGMQRFYKPTILELDAVLAANPELSSSVLEVASMDLGVPVGMAAAMHTILHQVDDVKAATFFDELKFGANPKSAAYALLAALTRLKGKKKGMKTEINQLWAIATAFEAHCLGASCKPASLASLASCSHESVRAIRGPAFGIGAEAILP